MLKFKYLLENYDLAAYAVEHYDYDNLEYFKYFRISSNAIYPFQNLGQVYYLRLTPASETTYDHIEQEISVIDHLYHEGFSVMKIMRNKANALFSLEQTPYGDYFVTAFERVPGQQIEDLEMTEDLAYKMGKKLGELHKLSRLKGYLGRSHQEVLAWMLSEFQQLNADDEMEAVESLMAEDENLDKDQYGLVHYDFDLDNLFYDGQEIYCIDFNDMMTHYLEMDLVTLLDAMASQYHDSVLRGYHEWMPVTLSEDRMDYCRRFDRLFTRCRIMRAIAERLDDEPEWMTQLREKLEARVSSPIK